MLLLTVPKATVPRTAAQHQNVAERALERLQRRTWPLLFTAVFFCLGMLYFFRWGPVVQHVPSLWESPNDLWGSYAAASAYSHGHFNSVYSIKTGFLALPGLLILLAPIALLGGYLHTTLIEIGTRHHYIAHPQTFVAAGVVTRQYKVLQSGKNLYVLHSQVFQWLGPYEILLACVALFACDALAERLEVAFRRRAVLGLAEAVVLWNVAVTWGHPEDALAVALAVYALIFAIDGRFTGVGWLFGAALAVQPLVIVIFPILLAKAGKKRAFGLVLRGLVPAAVVTLPPLALAFHTTIHALTQQPTFPHIDHATPWTTLAPKLGGTGTNFAVGGGPTRVVSLLLAGALGWWALRWRSRPEMLMWAAALALALRCYTESVMTAYYIWPALAVALVVAARGSQRRFAVVVVLAVVTTVVAQWRLGELPWWAIDVAGMSAVLIVAARPDGLSPDAPQVEAARFRGSGPQRPTRSAASKTQRNRKKKKKAAARARR
jgi:hypothetical protein